MDAYESGHFYAFNERTFWISTFVNIVFVAIAIYAYFDLNDSFGTFAILFLVGAIITLLIMCFNCFVKYKFVQWAKEDDGGTEMGTR